MEINLLSIIALLIAVGAFVINWRKAKPERTSLKADAAESYATAASNFAQQVCDLQKRIDELEAGYTVKFAEQQQEIDKLRRVTKALSDWAHRLSKQVAEMGGVPVPYIEQPLSITKRSTKTKGD